MNVNKLVNVMNEIAPLEYAAEWDNVGLLVGSSVWPADSVLLTIDLTWEVLQEAIETKANVIIAYHPPIFAPLKAITDGHEKQRIILEAIRAGIAIYSPHTALDAAPGGVNDWLASALGEGEASPLEAHESLPPGQRNKIITMCPADAVDTVHQAMSQAGAGVIGDYEQCAFTVEGSGRFFGSESTAPAVGEKGRLEHIEESRLEMVCSNHLLAQVIDSLRGAHPYEEPPIEIFSLKDIPSSSNGPGRIVKLHHPLKLEAIVSRLKTHLDVDHLKVAPGRDAPANNTSEEYETIGLCPGAGASLLRPAMEQNAQLFLTGELRHHEVMEAIAQGCTIILAGHTNTERGYLKILEQRLSDVLDRVTIIVSKKDRSPFTVH